jgi:hypothetical protein
LIYRKTWEYQIEHVDRALQLLQDNHLFVKRYKCAFRDSEVENLGHIVSQEGVQVDPKKAAVMQNWPRPKTLKSLHGFLGLIGYYKKFVKNYEKNATPLASLQKNNAFVWNEVVEQAFSTLKYDMCTTLVLTMPNFTKTFFLECDASGRGLGAILM